MQAVPPVAALASGLLLAGSASAQAPALTPSVAGATVRDAQMQFAGAHLGGCLASREAHGGVADLPASARAHFQPAAPGDRAFSLAKSAATPVWITPASGGRLTVDEPTPERCEVLAIDLPVEATFQLALAVARQTQPDFADVPAPKGYNPIAYQLERTVGAETYVIRVEGSEPGELAHPGRMLAGHAFRFSLLRGYVERRAATAR